MRRGTRFHANTARRQIGKKLTKQASPGHIPTFATREKI